MRTKSLIISLLSLIILVFSISGYSAFLNSDQGTLPYNAPSYTPNVNPAIYTFASGVTGEYGMVATGLGTAIIKVSGTCTGLAAVARGSLDGSTWVNLNLYPVATGTTAPVAVASISATGIWKVNPSGFSMVELQVTALTTGPCIVDWIGSPAPFNGISF